MDTKAIARELLAKNILSDPSFTLKELFEIRDACMTLGKYGLEDNGLLQETLKYLGERVGE